MPTLADSLLVDDRRERLVADCAETLSEHVSGIKGLRGIGLRTSLSLLKAGRPDAVPGALQKLMPEFIVALEPQYQSYLASRLERFGDFLMAHRGDATAALLSVTDARVANATHATLKSVYPSVRGAIETELKAALPKLAAVIDRHLAA